MQTELPYDPLTTRLRRHYDVDPADLKLLENLPHEEQQHSRGDVILARGSEKPQLMLVLAGWVMRVRYTPEGGRQIVHILLPGDLITPDAMVTRTIDHEVAALSDTKIRLFDANLMRELLLSAPSLAAGLWWCSAQEDGMLREQIVRLGRRSAMQRVPHLLLELQRRLTLVDQATSDTLILPLTQNDIADALGLSPVHINRTLRQLVQAGLIVYDGSVVQIPDQAALAASCDFDTQHLHLDKELLSDDAN